MPSNVVQKGKKKLNSKIMKKIKLVESGKVMGKSYTPSEYLEHIEKILNE